MLVSLPLTYVLRRLATILLQPLGIAMLLLLCALVLRRRKIIAGGLVVLYVSSAPVVAKALFSFWENRYEQVDVEACPSAEGIVVLGGVMHTYDGRSRIEWAEAVDRFEMGLQLYRAGKAPRLIFSGAKLVNRQDGLSEGDAMRAAAIERGAPPEALRVARDVFVTADEARRVQEMGVQEGFRRVILVTSAFHMTRSVFLFERAGMEVVPFPVDYQLAKSAPFTLLDLAPQSGALGLTEAALKEFYGMAYYRVFEK